MKVRHTLRRVIITLLGTMVIAGGVFYEYILPERTANEYLASVHSQARKTKKSFQVFTAKIDDMTYADTSTPPAKRAADVAALRRTLDDARQSVASLEKVGSSLQVFPLTGYIGTYPEAAVTRRHANDFAARARTSIAAYEKMLTQSENYLDTIDSAAVIFADFNKTSDINTYAGQSGEIRESARRLTEVADALQNQTLPSEYGDARNESTKAIRHGAEGFSRLATALDNPIDDDIYAAVREIEAATTELDMANRSALDAKLSQSRTVRELRDLVETIDYLTG